MKISVVIPSYNSGKFLPETLDSIFAQDYPDFEIVVADGYSTDDTWRILHEYEKKHENLHVYLTRTEGEVGHLNFGMERATGDIVSWLCADDTYELGCFAAIEQAFNHPDVQWIYGRTKIIDHTGAETRTIITRLKEILQPRYSYTALLCACFIAEPSVFMRRSFYQQVGPYNPRWPLTADYDYWLRAGKISRPRFIDQHLANWRAHNRSTSVNRYRQQMQEAYQVQKQHSRFWLRPVQQAMCLSTTALYKLMEAGAR